MKYKALFLFLILLLSVIGYASFENFKGNSTTSTTSTCKERGSCSTCLNGYDNTGSLCHWCSSGCSNGDDLSENYLNNMCTTDKRCNLK